MPLFTGFSHIYLPVRDVDESIEFYTSHFGFTLLRKYQNAGSSAPSCYLELGDVLLELTKARGALPGDEGRVESRIGLTVPDMDAAWADLTSKGAAVSREPYDARTFWGRQAQVTDPNGYGISLREWAKPDNPHFDAWQPRHEGVTRLS